MFEVQRVAYFQEAATNAEGLFDVVQIQELIKRSILASSEACISH